MRADLEPCSRDFLSMCGDRSTVKRSMRVGSGIGPAHLCACALRRGDDLARGRIQHAVIERLEAGCGCSSVPSLRSRSWFLWKPDRASVFPTPPGLLHASTLPVRAYSRNFGDDAGSDGSAAFADGEAQLLFHRDRRDQVHRHFHIIAPA